MLIINVKFLRRWFLGSGLGAAMVRVTIILLSLKKIVYVHSRT